MATARSKLTNHFTGALLGTFAGDALGMPYEGSPPHRFDGRMRSGRMEAGAYTDDTEMAIGLAEALIESPERFDPERTAARFLENFHPARGYGGRIYGLMRRLAGGESWDRVATDSWGNGAAMRVAPVGAFYYDKMELCVKAARLQAIITHTHPLGVAGAVAQAIGVALAVSAGMNAEEIQPSDFAEKTAARAESISAEMAAQLRQAACIEPTDDTGDGALRILRKFPCDVSAIGAVPAALAAFLMTSSFEKALILAVSCGGDADTVAAMTGALAGAYYGANAIPRDWIHPLENGAKGRDYVIKLAEKLAELK